MVLTAALGPLDPVWRYGFRAEAQLPNELSDAGRKSRHRRRRYL